MRPSLVIFDCDGVLVDSEGIANRALAAAVTAHGLALDEAGSRREFVGLSMTSVMARIEVLTGKALPPDWLPRLQAETYDGFRAGLQAVPGIAAAVAAVRSAGLATCVASSGTPDKMALTLGLTGLAPLFEGRIFSALEVRHGKPAPDLFLHAAARMGHEPGKSVVVEDSVPGVTGAVAAGMRALGFARETDARLLAAAGAETFTDMAALPALLGLQP
ncbi:HAD family hydrolase [Zavarzinia compransoris]|uniref:HAD family hydrolase n=1 Tax=Zavarzinia compransoris TaxID=1264899 RepID=UPI0010D25DA0|nr:HAD-IA family hydrolase [Zavarzinia compransoris]TDP48996.1 HAD superfamily hydrolase (TIGR01509 family) [Zavarzinia compransoris]